MFIAIAIVVQSGISGLSAGISSALSVGILSVDGIIAITTVLLQLILEIAFAMIAIYLALMVLDHLTRGINEFQEIGKGNVVVALEMAGVIIAVAMIIKSGVMGITAALI
ncbi:MAG: DUF350 domain-containing protein [Methanomicrobiales archaeon]|nr:DUF350 domain-containing protein [Methanomicrobiales archaeon]